MSRRNCILRNLIFFLCIPLCIVAGIFLFSERASLWISLCIALFACVPFFLTFEHGVADSRRMALLAALVALSVLGRFVFAAVPHFKPVAAIVILTGMYLGAESGFLCGALSAILSNALFGQGPWTPFQMFLWGMIGFFAAVFSRGLKKNKILLAVYAVLAGCVFSLMMDVLTVLWINGSFRWDEYFGAVALSGWVTLTYALSNVVFLLILANPIGGTLERIIRKYGI